MAEGYIEGAHAAGPGLLRRHESGQALLHDIEASGALPAGISAEAAVSGVLCTLAMRLTAGEADNFFASLPDEIRPLLRTCTLHRDAPTRLFDKPAFFRMVAHHFGIGADEAEPIARAVLRATRARIPSGEVHGVEGQLPKDLKELWTAD